jgi:hypothetical protein
VAEFYFGSPWKSFILHGKQAKHFRLMDAPLFNMETHSAKSADLGTFKGFSNNYLFDNFMTPTKQYD